MIRRIILASAIIIATSSASMAGDVNFMDGIFIVNEDWYGHQNSTVNYLLPDDPDGNYWHYRVIQEENPGKELGCTNQYAAIWDGRFYFIAKQDKDPGASVAGGRITVADAATMKILYQSAVIDPSGKQCDGRGFVGVDKHKGYISSSNGIWIFDLDNFQIKGQVKGSTNPDAGDDKPNTDPTGSLYHGQTGTMVLAAGKVFAAHQQYGLLVIDPVKDEVISTLSMDMVAESAGIGSVVKSKDGFLWLSVAKDTKGSGTALPYLVRVDPATLEYTVIDIPDDMYGPANSWYAWTPDAFVASEQQNVLYWKGGTNRWFSGSLIYKFDCDTRETSLFIDLDKDGESWKIYGCSLGVHPETDEIYMSLYHEFTTPTYVTRRYSTDGIKISDYAMIDNYWFPSLFVFPQSGSVSSVAQINDAAAAIAIRGGVLYVDNACGSQLEIFTPAGVCVDRRAVTSEQFSYTPSLSGGLYIVKAGQCIAKIRL